MFLSSVLICDTEDGIHFNVHVTSSGKTGMQNMPCAQWAGAAEASSKSLQLDQVQPLHCMKEV